MRLYLPPKHYAVNINPAIEKLGVAGIEAFIERYALDTSEPPVAIRSNTRGDLAEKTINEYRQRWVELRKFFFMIGDYQSAALCDREKCPANPLPIKPESLCMYLDFKFGENGTKLLKHGTADAAMLDVSGNQILCQGEWNCPDNADKIRTAVHCLHNAYENLRGPYFHACQACAAANPVETLSSGQFYACRSHAGQPHLLPRGNVVDYSR
jgi:hypothetical protein